MSNKLLEIQDLTVTFKMYEPGLKQKNLPVITNLCINVDRGEVLAIVGSSGSGKSLLAHTILGILPENAAVTGMMKYQGEDLTEKKITELRGNKIAFIPQSISFLDPLMRVGKQVQGTDKSREGKQKQRKAFERYQLCEKSEKMFPYQLSGGMARRVLLSTAVVNDAELIVADEPTPGLDTAMAVEALKTFRELADTGHAILLITHDIDLAFQIADKIAVFYAGTTVELSPAADFQRGHEYLRHPYTKALYNALPQNGFQPIPGFQPFAGELPKGCLFGPRCPQKTKECENKIPMRELRGGMVRCVHAT